MSLNTDRPSVRRGTLVAAVALFAGMLAACTSEDDSPPQEQQASDGSAADIDGPEAGHAGEAGTDAPHACDLVATETLEEWRDAIDPNSMYAGVTRNVGSVTYAKVHPGCEAELTDGELGDLVWAVRDPAVVDASSAEAIFDLIDELPPGDGVQEVEVSGAPARVAVWHASDEVYSMILMTEVDGFDVFTQARGFATEVDQGLAQDALIAVADDIATSLADRAPAYVALNEACPDPEDAELAALIEGDIVRTDSWEQQRTNHVDCLYASQEMEVLASIELPAEHAIFAEAARPLGGFDANLADGTGVMAGPVAGGGYAVAQIGQRCRVLLEFGPSGPVDTRTFTWAAEQEQSDTPDEAIQNEHRFALSIDLLEYVAQAAQPCQSP